MQIAYNQKLPLPFLGSCFIPFSWEKLWKGFHFDSTLMKENITMLNSYIYNPVTLGLYLGTFVSSRFEISHCYTQKFKYCWLLIASLYIVTKPSIRMVKKQLRVHSKTCHVNWEWSIWPEVDHPTCHLKQKKTGFIRNRNGLLCALMRHNQGCGSWIYIYYKNPHQGGFTCTTGIGTYK